MAPVKMAELPAVTSGASFCSPNVKAYLTEVNQTTAILANQLLRYDHVLIEKYHTL